MHTFVLSTAEWINKTNAIGLYVKRGKYGGTYAHKDIAFEFGMWISPKFKLLLIKEFERLIRLNKIAISQMEILTETNKKLLKD